jgi:hypothetical protein
MINFHKNKNKIINFLKDFKQNNFRNSENFHKRLLQNKPYDFDINDCVNLYNKIIETRRLCVLEFGSGWSTLIIAKALYDLKKKYFKKVSKIRKRDIFCLYVLETSSKFKNISMSKIPNYIKKEIKITAGVSGVIMSKYRDSVCNTYKKIPNCNPDFVYIDGPHIKDIKGHINNINFSKNDIHYFTLKDDSLGIHNDKLLRFYKNGT